MPGDVPPLLVQDTWSLPEEPAAEDFALLGVGRNRKFARTPFGIIETLARAAVVASVTAAGVSAQAAADSAHAAAASAATAATAGATAGASAGATAGAAAGAAAAEAAVIFGNIATIAALRSVQQAALPDGFGVMVRGYHADHDGGGGPYVWKPASTAADNGGTVIRPDALTSLQAGRWVRSMYGLNPTPQMFGAKCNGTSDDAPAIQAASNASKVLWFPDASYLFRSQVVLTNSVSHWEGLGGHYPGSTTAPGPRLVYHADLGSAPMIDCQTNAVFAKLGFRGPSRSVGTAVRCKRVPGDGSYEDTDVAFVDCNWTQFSVPIEHWMRGLHVNRCGFGICNNAVRLNWDDANVIDDPDNPFDMLPFGWRAIRFELNRLHLVTTAIVNVGNNAQYLRGLSVIGNKQDAGDRLFIGGLMSGLFANNTCDQTNAIAIEFTTHVEDVSLADNELTGGGGQGTEPESLIAFRETVGCFSLTGGKLAGATKYGVSFSKDVAGGSISGVKFLEIGTPDDSTQACVRFFGDVQDVAIGGGNHFRPRYLAHAIRGTTSKSWAGVVVQGNTRDRTKTWVTNSYTDGGNNSIQA